MTKEEFTSLPPALALGLLYDAVPSLAGVEAPTAPLPPRYDLKLPKSGRCICASEMELASLEWYLQRSRESAESGGPYAEKDAKRAESLERWVAWRKCEPTAQWSGTRGDIQVTADPPSREPTLRDWQEQPQSPQPPAQTSDW